MPLIWWILFDIASIYLYVVWIERNIIQAIWNSDVVPKLVMSCL